MSSSVKEIRGFSVLPVVLPSTAVQLKTFKKPARQYIYIKKHSINSTDTEAIEKANRSLFVINLPISTTFKTIKAFFGKVATGAVVETFEVNDDFEQSSKVDILKLTSEIRQGDEENNSSSTLPFGCALVTFVDKAACSLAFTALKKLITSSKEVTWEFDPDFGGLKYFDLLYAQEFLNASQLSAQVSQDMLLFAQQEQQAIEELQEMKEVVDEDGFTLVVGSHRKTKSGVLGKLKAQQNFEVEKLKSKMKKKEKQDFYRFQIRERKKLEMNDLLNKFKEDQERIKIMKQKRRFNPY